MIYSLNKIKNARFYYGTGHLYMAPASGHQVAIAKAREESKNGESVYVYIEADGVPVQMIRAYKGGALEYTAERIQKA